MKYIYLAEYLWYFFRSFNCSSLAIDFNLFTNQIWRNYQITNAFPNWLEYPCELTISSLGNDCWIGSCINEPVIIFINNCCHEWSMLFIIIKQKRVVWISSLHTIPSRSNANSNLKLAEYKTWKSKLFGLFFSETKQHFKPSFFIKWFELFRIFQQDALKMK